MPCSVQLKNVSLKNYFPVGKVGKDDRCILKYLSSSVFHNFKRKKLFEKLFKGRTASGKNCSCTKNIVCFLFFVCFFYVREMIKLFCHNVQFPKCIWAIYTSFARYNSYLNEHLIICIYIYTDMPYSLIMKEVWRIWKFKVPTHKHIFFQNLLFSRKFRKLDSFSNTEFK